ncbi:MAG TPA: SDR family oxidoreductase [Oligoflexia bacterium]|nr:SDR family oxidoreductase [Oligoflexia bacterium]
MFDRNRKVALLFGANQKLTPPNMVTEVTRVFAAPPCGQPWQIVLVNRSGADALAAEINASGGTAVSLKADVVDPAQMERLAADFAALFTDGPPVLDTLVYASGVVGKRLGIEDEPIAEAVRILHTKTIGFELACKLFAKCMAGRNPGKPGGDIIFISSLAAGPQLPYGPLKADASYVAGSAGGEGLAGCAVGEFGRKYGVRCNVLAPGPTEGEMVQSMGADLVTALRERTILKRLPTPRDVAYQVWFWAGELHSAETGQYLQMTCGL